MDAIREIVIESIERCRRGNECNECAYDDGDIKKDGCINKMLDDALALLKEQEPKRGKWIDVWQREDPFTSSEGKCSVCGKISERPLGNFCRWCGAKMCKE